MKPQVWSCGGGTQSAAIAAMIVNGDLPKPDLAVMADTSREASETWRFFCSVLQPALSEVGVEVFVVDHSYATVDIFSGKDGDTIIMPMHTKKSGQHAVLPKFCSQEWKTRPVQRFCRERGIKGGEFWIGFSIDEMERMRRYDERAAWNHIYPLVDKRMTRGDCIALVEKMGWGTPPRSSCWMCPYRSDPEWRHLKSMDPVDFQQAVELEKELQRHDADVFFHRSCIPLGEIEFDEQEDMFAKPCNSGHCFT